MATEDYDIHTDVKHGALELDGALLLDFEVDGERRTVELGPRQGMVVPHGVMHRTRADRRTVVLMVEPATVIATGD